MTIRARTCVTGLTLLRSLRLREGASSRVDGALCSAALRTWVKEAASLSFEGPFSVRAAFSLKARGSFRVPPPLKAGLSFRVPLCLGEAVSRRPSFSLQVRFSPGGFVLFTPPFSLPPLESFFAPSVPPRFSVLLLFPAFPAFREVPTLPEFPVLPALRAVPVFPARPGAPMSERSITVSPMAAT